MSYELPVLKSSAKVGLGFFAPGKAHTFHCKLARCTAAGLGGALRAERG